MAEDWTDEELAASVKAYKKMLRYEAEQRPFSKKAIYRELAAQFNRTEKAFEYRMQNISSVLHELGRPWVRGLKPAPNVGTNVRPRLIALIERGKLDAAGKLDNLAPYKSKLPAMRSWLIEVARARRVVFYLDVMQAFEIDRFSLRHAMDYLGHQAENLDEPILTAIIVSKQTGRCSSGFKAAFGIADDEAERQRVVEYWAAHDDAPVIEPPDAPLEVRTARFVSVEARPEQAAFRYRVFKKYKGRCVVSGCDLLLLLDAAHKRGRDWRKGHNSADDGFILRKDLHALYDADLLNIADDGSVTVDAKVIQHYGQFVMVAGPC